MSERSGGGGRRRPSKPARPDPAPLPDGDVAKPSKDQDGSSRFPIVGVGASAGGLEALTQFLTSLPSESGMAFLLVQHLDPRHESRLAELLGRSTTMPVVEATDGLAVRPNHVYVIPPNTNLGVSGGVLRLTPRGPSRSPHLPIDFLFRSLAIDQEQRAIAVVLSGTGSDGTQGVGEVKVQGGITFAQDPGSAAHAGMPNSAVESGCIDFVLPPAEIARRLGTIGNHPYLAPSAAATVEEPSAEQLYRRILAAVGSATGVDFSLYRDTTIKRRILRRMALHNHESMTEYLERLRTDRGEIDSLYRDLLISVTRFFRDPEMFEALKTTVLPELVDGRQPNDPFRIWVPGCSSGQEAYSLAMTVLEFYDARPVRPPIQIFATDLSDPTALDRARAGVYPEGIEHEVSPERLRRFFKREDHQYRIDKRIRELCVFARQNLTADPPFSHLDLISCRNLLIYLQPPMQKRIIPMFHYALNLPGYLILGTAETVGEFSDLFDLKDRAHRIYAKKPGPPRQQAFFPIAHRIQTPFHARRGAPLPGPTIQDFQKEVDRLLLGRYAPPGVLVDESLEVLQFRGKTSAFLESPSGDPTTNLLKLAREGLFLDLRNALTEAKSQNGRVRREGVWVRTEGGGREVTLEVTPVTPRGGGTCYLVLFEEVPSSPAATEEERPQPASPADAAKERVHLRQELDAAQEYVQSMMEQQDAANEELRSANEEILSSNEELQSTNEELETAKEELQSANEELTTVNEQLHRRNQELDQTTNDLTNLLSSSNIPVVMVGPDLRIRRVTPAAKRAMNVMPTDLGRLLGDIKLSAVTPDIDEIIHNVIENVQPVEREVRDRDGRYCIMRVYPYRTADSRIDGAVILLVDVDQLRRAQEELQIRADQLTRQGALIELSLDAVVVRNARNEVIFWNRGAELMYGWSSKEAVGQPLDRLLSTDSKAWEPLNEDLDRHGTWEGELRQIRRDGTPLIVQSREVLVRDEAGRREAVLSIKRDVTELREAVEGMREADRRKDEFLAMLAHELRNPLAPIRNAVEIIRRAGGAAAAVQEASEMLERQIRQLGRIVDDLVDVTGVARKKVRLRKEQVLLKSLVDSALESTRSLIAAARCDLDVDLPDEPLYLFADPVRIAQVLINLLNNAAKYSDPGGQIVLSAEPIPATRPDADPGARDVLIRVCDTGIGIPSDLLPKVFDMFTQGVRAPERGWGGLGVGLTLVRSLVEMHGGRIEAQSDGAGKGSEFVLRLPLAAESSAGDPPADRRAASRESVRRRIMVVDDSKDLVQSLGMLLKLMGHEVHMAYGGREALESIEGFHPDLALIDIGMPDVSGYEVARRIRANSALRSLVLVAQTGGGQESDRRRSREAGFDHHLVKPVAPEAIEEILASLPDA